jgi:Spy/CpxP family protein refolding chaperone
MQAMALQGITLTAAQQAKVDSITAKTRAQMPPMTPGTPPSDTDRQKMMALSMASVQEVRTVLTPEQQAVYDKNVTQMQQMMQQRMQGGAQPATPAAPGAPGTPATPATPAKP